MEYLLQYKDIFSVILLFFQLLLLFGQLKLSAKINKQAISKDKGYFIIDYTNLPFREGDEKIYRDRFSLIYGVGFYVAGNSDVIIRGVSYTINGRSYSDGVPQNTFFTLNKRANKLKIDLNLNESQLQKEQLDIEFRMKLENPTGFRYTEVISTSFHKESEDISIWMLNKFNISFE